MRKSPLLLSIFLFIIYCNSAQTEDIIYNPMGLQSTPPDASVSLTLVERFQRKKNRPNNISDHYDKAINSPKSASYLSIKNKLYIQNLEGFNTAVYDIATMQKIKVIKHIFNEKNQYLFKNQHTIFDYQYKNRTSDFNFFAGKPVESCFSHKGKYLWVSYYRRSYDINAESPSALAIIDTDFDSIVRVMPTGLLPKMITASPDNRYIAVTHWGDNTLAFIDVSSNNPNDFFYIKHLIVEFRLRLDYQEDEKINRDKQCGYCLRGTVFTPDSKYLLVGRMGGKGGIAIFDMEKLIYLGSLFGMQRNVRHLIIKAGQLIISTNKTGYVQSTSWKNFIQFFLTEKNKEFTNWKNCFVGKGVRTIIATEDGKYVFACVNNSSKIVVIETKTMQIIANIAADSFPVGMTITDNENYLIVTSQGKKGKGGNSVMIYQLDWKDR